VIQTTGPTEGPRAPGKIGEHPEAGTNLEFEVHRRAAVCGPEFIYSRLSRLDDSRDRDKQLLDRKQRRNNGFLPRTLKRELQLSHCNPLVL
jgi:hypothetical protein